MTAAHRLANFFLKKPEPITKGKRWRGVVASLLFPGAGQFLQGRRVAAAIWLLLIYIQLPVTCLLFAIPFIPIWLGWASIPLAWIVYILATCDACRPTGKVGWKGWLVMALVGLVLLPGIYTHVVFSVCRMYRVPSASMAPTIQRGDQVFCLRAAYWFCSPQRGDIIAFSSDAIPDLKVKESKETFVKRVVGLPGDVLKIKGSSLFVNGVPFAYAGQQENYSPILGAKYLQSDVDEYVVPAGMYFVLGDRPHDSYDSRFFGAIPSSTVRGKMKAIILPVSRASRLH